jgi:hypothetical protein
VSDQARSDWGANSRKDVDRLDKPCGIKQKVEVSRSSSSSV